MNKPEFNIKKSRAITKLNFRALRTTMIFSSLPAILMLLMFIIRQVILYQAFGIGSLEGNESTGIADMFLLIPIMCVIFLATKNFYNTMRLNAKKKDYFLSCLIMIAVFAFISSALITLCHYAVEKPFSDYNNADLFSLAIYSVFGFADSFVLIGFLQMFGFIFFSLILLLLLTSLQDSWVGWTIDILIAACISVFSSISVFAPIWTVLFDAMIFGHPALQICFTIFAGLALYSTYLLILKRKKI